MPWVEPTRDKPLAELLGPGILAHWRNLALHPGNVDPFCCAPVWNLAFYDVFCPGRKIFYASSPQGLILFAKYVTQAGDLFLLPIEDSWLFAQNLLGLESPFLLAAHLPELLAECADKKVCIVTSGIQIPSVHAATLIKKFRGHFQFYQERVWIQAAASLKDGVDGWLSRRSANHRAKLRKAVRKAKSNAVVFERIRPNLENWKAVYDRMLAVEHESWKGIGHCGMAELPAREFYANMLNRLALNQEAVVIFAQKADEDIGFIFGGLIGDVYRGQQFSYKAAFANLSIGNLLQFEKINWLCELGVKRYDMGPLTGPRMEYKHHWVEDERTFYAWSMRR